MNHSPAHALIFELPMLACETLAFGLAIFALAVVPAQLGEREAARSRSLAIVRYLAIAALLWAPLDLLHRAADMAEVTLRDAIAIVPEVLLGSHAGRVWMVRIVALAAMAAVSLIKGASRAKETTIAALAGLLLLLRALASHAIDKGALAVALYVLHEMSASVWLGSLLGLGFAVTAADPARWFLDIAPRVSRLAGWCVAVIAATGTFAAYDALGLRLSNLVDSSYGRTLMLKVGIAAIAIATGGYNRFRLIPRIAESEAQAALRVNVAGEVMVLVVVLGCSVILANTPPAH